MKYFKSSHVNANRLKKIILIIFILIYSLCFAADDDSRILQIKSEYKAIRDTLHSMSLIEAVLMGYSAEGGGAIGYLGKSGQLRLIEVSFYGEMGKIIKEYYFNNEELFFVFIQEHRYNVPFNIDQNLAKKIGSEPFDPRKTAIKENRFYFHQGELIRWIDGNKRKNDINTKIAQTHKENILKASKELKLEIMKQYKVKR